ncbi:hypothetical protein FIBSPDRAFT_871081 [Athelia psychrophila]|uniref:Uncharacterized protein n=1 Tax=Athelia psychrophila TaxID=1759441 RepID=A0A166AKA0_9AGAM|nr:hypothetical protein FIBSPDRAFT_871081 [Fibularhizoctonia sp. CBS 109695]
MRTAEVVWICDKSGVDTSSDPQPIGIKSGVHSFIWATPHACGHPILTHAQDADGNNGESKDAEEESPISDLDPVPISDRRHYTIVTILLLTGAAVMGIVYLVIHPPATLQHLTSHLPHLKLPPLHPFQRRLGASFRTGEGSLVKWAAADMLGGDEEEGDQFINGVDLENGEEIPLTPSPTKHGRGLFGTRYGAVSV